MLIGWISLTLALDRTAPEGLLWCQTAQYVYFLCALAGAKPKLGRGIGMSDIISICYCRKRNTYLLYMSVCHVQISGDTLLLLLVP